jgi:hypothetical protein
VGHQEALHGQQTFPLCFPKIAPFSFSRILQTILRSTVWKLLLDSKANICSLYCSNLIGAMEKVFFAASLYLFTHRR